MKNRLFFLFLIYFLTITIVGLIIAEDISTVFFDTGIIKFNLYDFLYIIGIIYIFKYSRYNLISEGPVTKKIILIIYFYVLYQIFVIFPLSILDNPLELSVINIIRQIVSRSFLIFIPICYWFVIPNFPDSEKILKFISYTALIVFFFHISNYFQGNFTLTETGNRRYGWGGGVLLYGFSFITNLSIFNKKKNNYLIIFISILGIILLAHRSAFFAVGFIFITAIFFKNRFNYRIFFSLICIFILFFIISEFTVIWEDFISRLLSSDINKGNLYGRLIGWAYGWQIFLQNPINGIKFNLSNYSNQLSVDYNFINIFHNFIMHLLVTEGAIGTIFHITIIVYIFKVAIKNIKDTTTYQMFYAFLYYLLIALFNVTYSNPMTYFFLIIPVSIILYRDKILNYNYEKQN